MANTIPTDGSMNLESSGKILDIERLRGIAIISVVFYHLSLSASLFEALGLKPNNMPFWLGVELFFVISGYVVTKSFLAKSMSLKQFFLRRVFRLWPTMAVLFVISFTINLAPIRFAHTEWPDLLMASLGVLFGVYNLLGWGSYYYGGMWSLSVEEQFYLAAPATMVLFAWAFRSNWRQVFWRFALAFSLILIVVRCLICFLPEIVSPYMPRLLGYLASYKFDFLAYGVMLYLVNEDRPILTRLTRNTKRILVVAGTIALLVLAYICGGQQR